MATIEYIGGKSGNLVWYKGKICKKKRLRTTGLDVQRSWPQVGTHGAKCSGFYCHYAFFVTSACNFKRYLIYYSRRDIAQGSV